MKQFVFIFVLVSLAYSRPGRAVDAFEIQVYDGEINKIGQYSLENHLNHVFTKPAEGETPVMVSSDQLTHLTFEFARGMTDFWEAGFYFQTAWTPTPALYYGGIKIRSKFVLPRKSETGLHLGANFEISDIPPEFEQFRWGGEIRPIIGWNDETWTFLFNPILEFTFATGSTVAPDFSPATKVAYNTKHGYEIGFEYYMGLQQIDNVPSYQSQEHYAFLAWDLADSPYELNFGIGTGLTPASNGIVGKGIFGFKFN